MRHAGRMHACATAAIVLIALMGTLGPDSADAQSKGSAQGGAAWTQEFDIENRTLLTTGENRYFVLMPSYQLVLEGRDSKVVVTVLDETRVIRGVTTRVVEEREEHKGRLSEVSKNYYAICKDTGDVFYFGEDVVIYKHGSGSFSASESWRAGVKGAKPGMMMPGAPSVGARYCQEIAPGVAMDRAEIVRLNETVRTRAGTFTDCLKTEETSGLDPEEKGYKRYAPGIGLIQDEDLLLTKYGYVKQR